MRSAPILLAVLTLVWADVAQGEPPPSASHVLIDRLGDERLTEELRLTPEQQTKLLAHRQKVWDEFYTTPPKDYQSKTRERERATAGAFKEVLSAEQLRRAEQLGLQAAWKREHSNGSYAAPSPEGEPDPTRVRADVLRQYPGLAEQLKLSDDQKRLAEDFPPPTDPVRPRVPNTRAILLTPEQTETARKLLGPIPAPSPVGGGRDPRADRYYSVRWNSSYRAPGVLGLLAEKPLRAELKVTEEQAKRIDEFQAPWKTFGEDNADASPSAVVAKADALIAKHEAALAEVLTPEQLTKLRQFAVRHTHDPAWGNTNESLVPNLAAELKVTAEQRKVFDAVRLNHASVVEKSARAESYADARRAIRAANAARDAELEAVLTAEQRAKLEALVGEQVPEHVRRPGLNRDPLSSVFGHYSNELTWLRSNKSIQAELKLTAAQITASQKALAALRGANPFRPRPKLDPDEAAKQRDENTKFIGEALANMLDEQQAKRFREIMLQGREYAVFSGAKPGVPLAVTYPGVAKAAGLTPEQKTRLLAGEHPLDVLSDAQRRDIRDTLGERFTGDYSLAIDPKSPRAAPRDRDTPRTASLPHLPVGAMKLAPEQAADLVTAINRYTAEVDAALGTPDKRPNPFAEPAKPAAEDPKVRRARATLDAEINRITRARSDREAYGRVDQLRLQSLAAHRLATALALPEVGTALAVTPLQRVLMADAEVEAGLLAELVVQARLPRDKQTAVLRRLREQLDERTLALLTHPQRAKWAELAGDPWGGFVRSLQYSPRFWLAP